MDAVCFSQVENLLVVIIIGDTAHDGVLCDRMLCDVTNHFSNKQTKGYDYQFLAYEVVAIYNWWCHPTAVG